MLKFMSMKDLRPKYSKLLANKYFRNLVNSWPIFAIFAVVFLFFWKFFILDLIPLPADFVVGTYYPWLDYKWGYAVGVPVKNPITSDVVSFSYPMRTLVADMLRNKELPLWNPYILTGNPLLANFQSAPFTFTNLFYLVFDNINGWSFQVITQHFFVILFTYFLLRNWKVSKAGSLLGGIIFAFSGFNLIWSQWNSHTLVAAFIPLMILSVDKLLDKTDYRFGIILSFSLFFQILAGYPQVTLYTFIALFLLWISRIRSGNYIKKSLFIAFYGLLGLGLAAFQILPGAELLNYSQRAVELNPFNWAFLPLVKVITFIAPDYFGNHSTYNYWGPQDYTSNVGFVGVGSLILALVSIYRFKKIKYIRFAVLLALTSLIMATSSPISVWIWNYGILGLKAASAHRGLVLWNFSIAILAAFGFDKIISSKKQKIKLPLLIPGLLLFGYAVVTFYLYFNFRLDPVALLSSGINKHQVGIRNLVFPTLIYLTFLAIFVFRNRLRRYFKTNYAVLLILLIIVELFRFGWKFTPFSPRELVFPETPVLNYLQNQEVPFRTTGLNVIPMNMRMNYRLESPEGYDAVYSQNIAQFLASSGSQDVNATTAGRYGFVDKEDSHLIDLVNTKYLLVHKTNKEGKPDPGGEVNNKYKLNEKYKTVFEDKSVAILESNKVLPRAFVVYQWETISSKKEILNELLNPEFPIDQKILLSESADIYPPDASGSYTLSYDKYSEQESIIRVKTNKEAMIFVSDLYYPGWKAYIDGLQTEIYKANFAFRAISIPEGTHTLRMIYQPESFFIGLKLSALSLIFIILSLFYLRKSKVS